MNPADAKKVFALGARVGSLEGYLYAGHDVEANYLPGWLDNIAREFHDLPSDVRKECREGLYQVMRKITAYLERLYDERDENMRKAKTIAAGVEKELAE